VFEILVSVAHSKEIDYSKYKIMTDKQLKKEITNIISKNKNLPFNAIIGKVMRELRGKAPGEKIVKFTKKLIE